MTKENSVEIYVRAITVRTTFYDEKSHARIPGTGHSVKTLPQFTYVKKYVEKQPRLRSAAFLKIFSIFRAFAFLLSLVLDPNSLIPLYLYIYLSIYLYLYLPQNEATLSL